MDSSNNNTTNRNSYERKLARQRQLDAMEAAASGTALPRMELLDNVHDGNNNMPRQRETARKFLYDEDDDAESSSTPVSTSLSSSGKALTTAQLLRAKQDHNKSQQVNLMDHATGVYSSDTSSIWSNAVMRFKQLVLSVNNEHDAAAGGDYDGDVFLGEADFQRRGDRHKHYRCCHLLRSIPRRVWLLLMTALALFIILYSTLMLTRPAPVIAGHSNNAYNGEKAKPAKTKTQKAQRTQAIRDQILGQGITTADLLDDPSTPAAQALHWVSVQDPQQLAATAPALMERFVLATFYYTSYASFASVPGQSSASSPVVQPDDPAGAVVPNPGWIRHDYWLSERGVCKWYGVRCQEQKAADGHLVLHYNDNAPVISLNLTANHVSGEIVPALQALGSLMVLDLSYNKLHGSVPTALGQLTELEFLWLARNNLNGKLSSSLGNLGQLRDLQLSHNRVDGTLPTELGRLSSVRHLGLDNNHFVGNVPDLSDCRQLRTLHLHNNRFQGNFPFQVVKLQYLLELRLEDNALSGTLPPEIESMRALQHLSLQNNAFTGGLAPHAFGRMDELVSLQLQYNQLGGELPPSMGDMAKLAALQLNNNKFVGSIPTEWGGMTALALLELQYNKLRHNLPSTIGNLTDLRDLYLHYNMMSGPLPTQLGQCTALETLYMEHNYVAGHLPSELAALTRLQSMTLQTNIMSGTVPANVCNLTSARLTHLTTDCKGRMTCDCCHKCY